MMFMNWMDFPDQVIMGRWVWVGSDILALVAYTDLSPHDPQQLRQRWWKLKFVVDLSATNYLYLGLKRGYRVRVLGLFNDLHFL